MRPIRLLTLLEDFVVVVVDILPFFVGEQRVVNTSKDSDQKNLKQTNKHNQKKPHTRKAKNQIKTKTNQTDI